jgi:hypothetical protein
VVGTLQITNLAFSCLLAIGDSLLLSVDGGHSFTSVTHDLRSEKLPANRMLYQQQQEQEQQQVGQEVVPPGVSTTLDEAEQVEP